MPHERDAVSDAAERLRSISDEIREITQRILNAVAERRLPDEGDEARLEELSTELAELTERQRLKLASFDKDVGDG